MATHAAAIASASDIFPLLHLMQESQRAVLKDLFLRTWPQATPLSHTLKNIDHTAASSSDSYHDFRYSHTKVGSDISQVAEWLTRRNLVMVALALPGAGKSHLLYQLAVQNEAYVVRQHAEVLTYAMQWLCAECPAFGRTKHELQVLTSTLRDTILKFCLAHTVTLLQLLRSTSSAKNCEMISPSEFLRFLEDGGYDYVNTVFKDLNSSLAFGTAWWLQKTVVKEIKMLTKMPLVEGWEETDELLRRTPEILPFTVAGDVPLWNIGSNGSVFTGTSLHLGSIKDPISSFMKPLRINFNCSSKFLRDFPSVISHWQPEMVEKSLREDMNIPPTLSSSMMEKTKQLLQGRAGFTASFKSAVFTVMKENPQMRDLNDIFHL